MTGHVKGIHFIWVGACHGGELKSVIDIGVDNFARFSIFFFDYVFAFSYPSVLSGNPSVSTLALGSNSSWK